MEHLQIDAAAEIGHAVDQPIAALRHILGGAGGVVLGVAGGQLVGGFKIVPE